MSTAKIHGAEYPVMKIFSNDFVFRIPLYQRPYSWTTEQAGELLSDLLGFIGEGNESLDRLSPYFLGCIVLIKQEGKPDAEIVDGQQRLTTLTILLSALRSLLPDEYAEGITDHLYEKGNKLHKTPNRYRLTLRERDARFFQEYVQDSGKIAELKNLDPSPLPDSQKNIQRNALLFLERLGEIPQAQRVRLGQFIASQCFLVVVTTPDFDSAYRIFSILNDRGLDLSHSDILKSEIIGGIPAAQQTAINKLWEDAEDELGREAFSDLFAHIRMIYRKAKYKESVLKEFREYVVKKVGDPRKLIEKVIIPYADAYSVIRTASYESTRDATRINDLLRWLNRLNNTDWVPPALAYYVKHRNDPGALQKFLADLERLAASMMIRRFDIYKRVERYGTLLGWIERGKDLTVPESPLQLTRGECKEVLNELDGDVYNLASERRLYILLRLDSRLSDGSASYDYGVVSIEHVLPQNPPNGSEWCRWFPTQEQRDECVHKVGNLLLLNSKKNSAASNKAFAEKKKDYFTKNGVSPFALTTQALEQRAWTPEVVERRQGELVGVLKKLWRL